MWSLPSPEINSVFPVLGGRYLTLDHQEMKVVQLCPTLCDSMDYIVHGILQARILERDAVPSPGDCPNPGIEPSSAALQVDSLPGEPPGKPKDTGVGSLSLLQQVFPIHESNQGHLHYSWNLYQLSYQGNPLMNFLNYFLFGLPSLVGQWLRIHLPMEGTQVRSLL